MALKEATQSIITKLNGTAQFSLVTTFNDQINRTLDGSGYSIPGGSAFIEWVPQTYNQIGQKVTATDAIVRIHLYHLELDAGDGTMDQNLNVFTYRNIAKKALNGFKPTNCCILQQVGESQDYAHTNAYHYVLEYATTLIDTTGSSLIITGNTSEDEQFIQVTATDIDTQATWQGQ